MFLKSCLYPLQTALVFYRSCLSMWVCLSWHYPDNKPESKKVARNCSTPPEDFGCVSLYGVPTNAAQLHNVRQTNICWSLAKTLSSHVVLSHVCFSRTSFLLCLLQQNFPSWVCLSLSPVSTSGKYFYTCLSQQNTIQHIRLFKEPLGFYFNCELTFTLSSLTCLLPGYFITGAEMKLEHTFLQCPPLNEQQPRYAPEMPIEWWTSFWVSRFYWQAKMGVGRGWGCASMDKHYLKAKTCRRLKTSA